MLFALDYNDKRVHISETHSNQEYYCEDCGARLIVRKGNIRIHHFAHTAHHECSDTWVSDRERKYDTSDWHNEWQENYPSENQEVRLSLGETKHRADVMIGKTVVEFQHSIMSANAFDDRNNFYLNLGCKVIWLFDIQELYSDGSMSFTESEEELSFRWRNPKKAFNAYDIKSGCIDLFFQISDNESACIVMVKDVSEHGFESFTTTKVMSKADFLNYTGLKDGHCLLPDRDDLATNEVYLAFKNKYGVCLNKQQERALQSIEGATLLLAVPGSGKTTVLVDRIGFMVLVKEIKPQSILAITYTKNAAEEMQQRCSQKFGADVGNKVSFKTINALSLWIYKKYYSKFSKIEKKLVQEKDQHKILADIYKKYHEDYATDSDIIELQTAFAYIKNMMLSDEDVEDCDEFLPKLSLMYQEYKSVLRDKNLMDYDDQMVFAHWILSHDVDALEYLRNQYRYICVDEAQDTSKIQHAIIKLLVGSNNLFMVGDEDQSIYGFRAAYPKALLNFRYDYKNPYILRMERNYRSTPQIVEKAQGFIAKNRGRYEKRMTAERDDGQPVQLLTVKDRKEQYARLLEIATNHEGEVAYLYRDNDSAVVLVDSFMRAGIPFQLKKPEANFFGNKLVRDIVSFLKLTINDRDVDSFQQICNKGVLYIQKKQRDWAIQNVRRKNISVFDAVDEQMQYVKDRYKDRGESFRHVLTRASKSTTAEAITLICVAGYERYIRDNHLDFDKIEILKILAEKEPNIADFLARLDFLESKFVNGFQSSNDNPVILSTIHSSKGLEYDSVYLVDVYDGRFPSAKENIFNRSKDNADGGQEERRLFYVGITRAKNQLNLIHLDNLRSSFLEELYPEIAKPQNVPNVIRRVTTSYRPVTPTQEQLRLRYLAEQEKRQQQEAERKRLREVAEHQSLEMCYEEVCHLFTQQENQIRDHTGRRWIKCEVCGAIKPETEFSSYGGANHVNLGKCYGCSREKK